MRQARTRAVLIGAATATLTLAAGATVAYAATTGPIDSHAFRVTITELHHGASQTQLQQRPAGPKG